MYVKLIQPKMKMRPMDTELKTRMSPPLGLYTIAGLLRDEHTVPADAFDAPCIGAAEDTWPQMKAVLKALFDRDFDEDAPAKPSMNIKPNPTSKV